jgi:carbon storage regulator
MLVLTRKVGQSIVVGSDIVITITEVRGEKVKVGVEAPHDVVVDRQEVSARRAHEGCRDGRSLSL